MVDGILFYDLCVRAGCSCSGFASKRSKQPGSINFVYVESGVRRYVVCTSSIHRLNLCSAIALLSKRIGLRIGWNWRTCKQQNLLLARLCNEWRGYRRMVGDKQFFDDSGNSGHADACVSSEQRHKSSYQHDVFLKSCCCRNFVLLAGLYKLKFLDLQL